MTPLPFVLPSQLWAEMERLGDASVSAAGPARLAWRAEAVERHRLLPVAVAARAFGEDPLQAVLEARHDVVSAALQQQAAQQALTLQRALQLLPEGMIVVIKGADLGRRLYGDAVLRPMDDIDLLVREDARDAALAALARAGWPRLRQSHLEVSVRDPQTAVVADLYRGFTQRERADIDYADIWREAHTGWHGGLALHPVHALLTESLVIANLQFITHLRKLLDIWLLADDAPTVFEAIALAGRWKLRRALFSCLHQLAKLAPELHDAPWWGALESLLPPSVRRYLVDDVLPPRAIIDRATPAAASATRLRRKYALIDTPLQRLHFTAAHALRLGTGRA